MAKFTIYSKDGRKVRHVGEPQYSGSYMGVDFVEFRSVNSPAPIEWQIGDYVDYFRTGKRYKLYSFPMPNKVARANSYGGSFEYSSVKLFAATKELEIAPFRDLVPEDNKIHFSTRPDVSTYENVYGIARRIQECINDIFPNRWRVEVFDTDDADLLSLLNETREYSVSGGSCLDALSQIYETWKNVGWIHIYDSANNIDVITIGRTNVRDAENTSDVFAYGKGNGLTSIRKATANEGEFATRLYVYGSERNIQTRYYNGLDILNKDSVDIRNLMLPVEVWGITDGKPDARKAYLQADDSIIEKYGLIPRTVYFDGSENEEIYPSIKGLTERDVRNAMIDAGQGESEYIPFDSDNRIDKVFACDYLFDSGDKDAVEKSRTFRMFLHKTGFDIATQGKLTSEGYATISMISGKCAGREFKVKRSVNHATTQELVLERAWNESLAVGFPNMNYQIEEGDEFVLLDIPMPDYYVSLAEDRLLSAGEKILSDYTRVSAYYEPNINSIKIKDGGKPLYPGMFMQIQDNDVVDTESHTDFVLIDTLTIDESAELPSYRVTLREQKRAARNYAALEDMIEDAKESAKESIAKERKYSDRRFRDVQETIGLLQGALDNFSEGINPITVQTMVLMLGDQSLQYKFTASRNSLTDIDCPVVYDAELKQMYCSPASLIHMTLGVESIVPADVRIASDFKGWNLSEKYSETLEDGNARYVYIRSSVNNENDTVMVVSESAIAMNAESGYYHFLVGVLNSEYEGSRSFVTLYGYTEVLPGQITTDKIRSGNNALVIDLANAIITAKEGATIEGSIKITEGSLMSSRLDVGDTKTGEVEAFFNGGNFAADTSEAKCGKLILAAGIPTVEESGLSGLAERAAIATTRIYEDGCTYTKNLHLQEGCTLGRFSVDRDGLNINGCTSNGGHSASLYGSNLSLMRNINDGYACKIIRRVDISTSDDADAIIDIDTENDAIRVRRGVFSGFRPKTRIIRSSYENSTYETPHRLTELDHTIIIDVGGDISDATFYFSLPEEPLDGQEYEIYTTDQDIDVTISSEKDIVDINGGAVKSGSVSFTQAYRRYINLIYSSYTSRWYMTYRNLTA